MKVAVFCFGAVAAIHLKGSPASIGGAGASGDTGAYGAGSSNTVIDSSSAAAPSAGLMSTLKSLMGEISQSNAAALGSGSSDGSDTLGTAGSGSGALGTSGVSDATTGSASGTAAALGASVGSAEPAVGSSDFENSARSKFVKGQMMHMAAANALETPEELEVEQAIRSAMSTPSKMGSYPDLAKELSMEYPTSFMKYDWKQDFSVSKAQISPSDLDAIGASIAAETNQYLTRASGCGACPKGVNYGACPSGFTEARSGECTPSPSYKGLCTAPVEMSGLSEVEKDEMEMVCDTCFKCA